MVQTAYNWIRFGCFSFFMIEASARKSIGFIDPRCVQKAVKIAVFDQMMSLTWFQCFDRHCHSMIPQSFPNIAELSTTETSNQFHITPIDFPFIHEIVRETIWFRFDNLSHRKPHRDENSSTREQHLHVHRAFSSSRKDHLTIASNEWRVRIGNGNWFDEQCRIEQVQFAGYDNVWQNHYLELMKRRRRRRITR